MNLFARNCELIAARDDLPRELIEASAVPAGYESRIAASGEPTARLDGKWIHSPRDPRQEASRLIEHHPGNGLVVFYGTGLAYQIEQYLETSPTGIAVVVEPETGLLRAAMETRDLEPLICNPRVWFLIGEAPEQLTMVLRANEHRAIRTVRLRSVYSRNREYYEILDTVQETFLARRDINGNTLRRFAGVWIRNLARNVPLLATAPGLADLYGRLKGLPGLMLAAGPSLDLVLPHMHEIQKRAVIIAVDTAAAALRDAGIAADFLVVVDPQWWNTRHLDRVTCERTILISESSTHPRVFRLLDSTPFFAESLFPLGRYLEKASRIHGALGAGGSVSTSAWDLARLLGCSPIYCAGLDLGFPDARTHCRGSFFEERAHTLSKRCFPGEHQAFSYISQADPFRVPDNRNGTVLTDKRMAIYHWWFENQAQIYREVDTRNLSPGGVRIDGLPYAPVEQLLEMPVRRVEIDRILAEIRTVAQPASDSGGELGQPITRLATMIESLVSELRRIEALCGRALGAVNRARRAQSGDLPSPGRRPQDALIEALRDLDAVDAELRAYENRDIAGFMVQDTLSLIMRGEHQQTGDALHTSQSLYEALEHSSRFHINELNRSLMLLQIQPILYAKAPSR